MKISPGGPFALDLRPSNGQLRRAQHQEFCPGEQQLYNRRSRIIAHQQICLSRRLEVHGAPGRNPETLPTASSRVLNAHPRADAKTSRTGVSDSIAKTRFREMNSSTGQKLHRVALSKEERVRTSTIARFFCRENFRVRPSEQPPPARRSNAINSCVLAADCHRPSRHRGRGWSSLGACKRTSKGPDRETPEKTRSGTRYKRERCAIL